MTTDISRGLRTVRGLLADPHRGNIEAASVAVDNLCRELGIEKEGVPTLTPDELALYLTSVAAYATAFGSLAGAVDKATEIVLGLRDLPLDKVSPEAAEMLKIVRGGR
jgi:hypothetical protein